MPGEVTDLAELLSRTPFDQAWDYLKPVIQRLYIDENRKLAEVINIVKDKYNFKAEYVLPVPRAKDTNPH